MTVTIQERSFEFACRIVNLTDCLAKQQGAGRALRLQILKAGTSIGANLEEATGGQSKADFISKCSIAAKEARETHYWLRLLRKTGSLSDQELTPLINEANELISILTTILQRASSSDSRGSTQTKR